MNRCIAALVVIVVASPAFAESSLVAPNADATVEGDMSNAFPFNVAHFQKPSMRYQQVYEASLFSSVSGPISIFTIAFRPDSGSGNAFGPVTLPGMLIRMSTTPARELTLSSTFADNIGPDQTTVFSGDLVLSSADTGGQPRNFDIVINLSTPFVYNPALGNLLLDVVNPTSTTTTQFDAAWASGDGTGRIWNYDYTSPTAVFAYGSDKALGLVTEFQFDPVPEPATLSLLAMGGLAMLRRKRK